MWRDSNWKLCWDIKYLEIEPFADEINYKSRDFFQWKYIPGMSESGWDKRI